MRRSAVIPACCAVLLAACHLVGDFADYDFTPVASGGAGGGGAPGGHGGESAACAAPEECPGEDTTCQTRTCTDGQCGVNNASAGVPCQEAGGLVCNGSGDCVGCVASADCVSPLICKANACVVGGVWARSFDNADGGQAQITIGPSNTLMIGGRFSGALALGGAAGTLNAGDGFAPDAFVAQLNATTAVASWAVPIELQGDVLEAVEGLAVSSANQAAYLLVNANSTLVVAQGSYVPVNATDSFLLHFDLQGTFAGVTDGSGNEPIDGRGLAVGSNDEPIIVGGFAGDLSFGPTSVKATGDTDVFVAVSDGLFGVSALEHFGGEGTAVAHSVATDTAGDMYVSGSFAGSTLTFGGDTFTSSGPFDYRVWVAQLDSDAKHEASAVFDGFALLSESALTPSGDLIVVGSFEDELSLGNQTIEAQDDDTDVFLACLSFDGGVTARWLRRIDGAATTSVRDLAVAADGSIVLLVQIADAVDLGGGTLTPASGFRDVAVLKLDADGNHLWSQTFGDSKDDTPRKLALDEDGNIYLIGTFEGVLDFGVEGRDGLAAAEEAYFVAKLLP